MSSTKLHSSAEQNVKSPTSRSKGFTIRKARGSRNLLETHAVSMDGKDNITDDKVYKGRSYSRNQHRCKKGQGSPKKKEISWADRIIGMRKISKRQSEKSEEDIPKNELIKDDADKDTDEMKEMSQTSVVYFSKSNSYDGRVVLASKKEENDMSHEKAKEKKHHKRSIKIKDEEKDRRNCMDAALAAAAVRAVVGVSPQRQLSEKGIPRAYRVKTSMSHSFLVEPVWNDGTQVSEDQSMILTTRPFTAPGQTIDTAYSIEKTSKKGAEKTKSKSRSQTHSRSPTAHTQSSPSNGTLSTTSDRSSTHTSHRSLRPPPKSPNIHRRLQSTGHRAPQTKARSPLSNRQSLPSSQERSKSPALPNPKTSPTPPRLRSPPSRCKSRSRSKSPPSIPLSPSLSWSQHHGAMVPAGTSSDSQALTVHEELHMPCNVSVNIQLVASGSNMSARALITDGTGNTCEVPASISWDSTKSKPAALSVLDSLKVSKTLEQALAKAVIENAKAFSTTLLPTQEKKRETFVSEKATTTASLENTTKIPLIEKSTNTSFLEERHNYFAREIKEIVTGITFPTGRVSRSAPVAKVSDFSKEMFETPKRTSLKATTLNVTLDNSVGKSIENYLFENDPKTATSVETEEKLEIDSSTDSIQFTELSKANSSIENMKNLMMRKKANNAEALSYNSEKPDVLESYNIKDNETHKSATESTEWEYPANIDKEEILLENSPTDSWVAAKNRAPPERWVSEVSRIVAEELKARAAVEQHLLMEERAAIRLRIEMEERNAIKERSALKEREKMEDRVAIEVRKVMEEKVALEELEALELQASRQEQEAIEEQRAVENLMMMEQQRELEQDMALERKKLMEEGALINELEKQVAMEEQATENQRDLQQQVVNEMRMLVEQHIQNEERKGNEERKSKKHKARKKRLEMDVNVDQSEAETDATTSSEWKSEQWCDQQLNVEGQLMEEVNNSDKFPEIQKDWEQRSTQLSEQGQTAMVERIATPQGVDRSDLTALNEYEEGDTMEKGATMFTLPIPEEMPPISPVTSVMAPTVPPFIPQMACAYPLQESSNGRNAAPSGTQNFLLAPGSNSETSQFSNILQDNAMDAMQAAKQSCMEQSQSANALLQNPATNIQMTMPFPGPFPGQVENLPNSAWSMPGQVPMGPFGPFGTYPPMPHHWYPPQPNPFVSGAWPHPGMIPYRVMMPYRPVNCPSHNTAVCSVPTSSHNTAVCPAPATSNSFPPAMPGFSRYQKHIRDGLGGCIPLNFATTRHTHPLMPIASTTSKISTHSVCEIIRAPRTGCSDQTDALTASVRTLFSKELEGLPPEKSLSKSMDYSNCCKDLANNYPDAFADESICGSVFSDQFLPNSEVDATSNEAYSQMEEKIQVKSERELAELLGKCSHAHNQKTWEEYAMPSGSAPVESLDARTEVPPRAAFTPPRGRTRTADDPLELLRQMRIRQQERELARARLPGCKVPLRRTRVVATCVKKWQDESTYPT